MPYIIIIIIIIKIWLIYMHSDKQKQGALDLVTDKSYIFFAI